MTRPTSSVSMVSNVNHVALMTGDIDRLAAFYTSVFGAEILARSDGVPRKCIIRVAPRTSLHVFQVGPERARKPGDEPFDSGSINHFALEARDPDSFVEVRDRLLTAGLTDGTVYDAPDLYSLFTTDPDGLFIEWVVRKTDGWRPPFPTEKFVGLNQQVPAQSS